MLLKYDKINIIIIIINIIAVRQLGFRTVQIPECYIKHKISSLKCFSFILQYFVPLLLNCGL